MRHQAAIFLGEELTTLANGVMKYILKYGHEKVVPYFSVLHWSKGDGNNLDIRKYQKIAPKSDFESDLENEYQVVASIKKSLTDDNIDAQIEDFIRNLHSETVTITNVADYETNKLLLTIYVPAFLEPQNELAKKIVDSTESYRGKFDIDIVALSPDIVRKMKDSPFFVNRMNSCKQSFLESVKSFAELAKDCKINQIAVLDNKNRNGFSLDMNTDSIVRTVGEYSLLTTESYTIVYNPSTVVETRGQISTFGLSSLYFDKYYFANYVLRKAYIDLIDKEKVDENVDVNFAVSKSKELLSDKINMVDEFWNNTVNPLLVQEKPKDDILNQIQPELENLYKQLEKELMTVLSDPTLTLPQKKAVLAEVTANDDESLKGNQFEDCTFSIDDLETEPVNFFKKESQNLEKGDKMKIDELPIDEINELRNKIRESTVYLRTKTKEIESLGKQIDNVEQCKKIVDGSFSYDGVQYKLLGNDIKEIPLDSTYEEHGTTERSVDLSDYFTEVKNQGSLGACTVFSLVSIYEYILKKNDGVDTDLSEMFPYYNARKICGKENEACGTSFYHVIKAMQNDGLCSNSLCIYKEDRYAEVPSADAYDDAKSRMVLSAMNLPVKIDAIRSAIADGFPIAMSFKIYDSFDAPKGFVQTPTEDEMLTEGEKHAMVIVGYSDDHKLLKVRNSWGKKFGDGGYCYIPYSWITNLNLACDACIITKISQNIQVSGVTKHESVDFDLTDATVKRSILSNLITEERSKLEKNKKEYADKRNEYESVIQKLGNNANRKHIIDASVSKRKSDLDEYRKKKTAREQYLKDNIEEYEKTTNKILLKTALAIIFVIAVFIVVWYYYIKYSLDIFDDEYALPKTTGIVVGVLAFVGFIVYFVFSNYRKTQQKGMESAMRDEISEMAKKAQQKQREIDELKLKGNIYSTAMDSLIGIKSRLIEKYRAAVSFVDNLKHWKSDEMARQNEMKSETNGSFIPMLSNSVLDSYLKENLSNITKDIYLYKYLVSDYKLDDKSLLTFKNNIKSIIVKQVMTYCADFNAVKSILGYDYKYVDTKSTRELLPRMQKYSEPFFESQDLKNEKQLSTSVIYIGLVDTKDKSDWNNEYRKHFAMSPSCSTRMSIDSIVLMQQRFVSIEDLVL